MLFILSSQSPLSPSLKKLCELQLLFQYWIRTLAIVLLFQYWIRTLVIVLLFQDGIRTLAIVLLL